MKRKYVFAVFIMVFISLVFNNLQIIQIPTVFGIKRTWYFRDDELLNLEMTYTGDSVFLVSNASVIDVYLGIRIFLWNGTEIISSGVPVAIASGNSSGYKTATLDVPNVTGNDQPIRIKVYYKDESSDWSLAQTFTSTEAIGEFFSSTWTITYYLFRNGSYDYYFEYGKITRLSRIEGVCFSLVMGSLIDKITAVIGMVNWGESMETIYKGYMVGTKTLQDISNAYNSLSDSKEILQWSAILSKYDVENETLIKTALNAHTILANGLPYSGNDGEDYYIVDEAFLLYGFYFAEKYNYQLTQWNKTKAYLNFDWSIQNATTPILRIYHDNTTYKSGPRLYECDHTINSYLVFHNKVGISNALSKAMYWWNWTNNNLWVSDHYIYKTETPNYVWDTPELYQVKEMMEKYGASLGNTTRILTDFEGRYVSNRWSSKQWLSDDAPNTLYYAVIHHNPATIERRLSGTLMAWAEIFRYYTTLNSTYQGYIRDMLKGYSFYDPAWKLLLTSEAGLYDNSVYQFRWDVGLSLTNDATAAGANLLILLGIVPISTTLTVNTQLFSLGYVNHIIDGGYYQMSLTSQTLMIAVAGAGELGFQYNGYVTYDFPSNGTYLIQFSADWSSITQVIKLEEYTSPPVTGSVSWFMCSDTHTVNGVNAYRLNETNTASTTIKTSSRTGSHIVYWGFRVYTHHTLKIKEVTNGMANMIMWRINDGEGLQNSTLTVNNQGLDMGFEAVKIEVYTRIGGDGEWHLLATFITNRLLKTGIVSSEWTFSIYTNRTYTGGNTYSYFKFGNSNYAGAIYNVQLKEPTLFDWTMYKMRTGDLIGGLLNPYTYLIGSLFYAILLLIICIPLYHNYHSFTPILFVFILLGGVGAGIGRLIPESGLQIGWVLIVLGLAGLLYKVLR